MQTTLTQNPDGTIKFNKYFEIQCLEQDGIEIRKKFNKEKTEEEEEE